MALTVEVSIGLNEVEVRDVERKGCILFDLPTNTFHRKTDEGKITDSHPMEMLLGDYTLRDLQDLVNEFLPMR